MSSGSVDLGATFGGGGGGSGTVTSVGLTVPSFLSVAGSPVTTSGTLAITLATEAANLVFAGPTSGGAVAPTFRALVAGDLPGVAINAQTTTYTVIASDKGKVVQFTGSSATTFSLTAPATLTSGFACYLQHAGGMADLTYTPLSGTIDGAASIAVQPGDTRLLSCDGSNFTTVLLQGGFREYTAAGTSTFKKPTGATSFFINVVSAGGGGGSGARSDDPNYVAGGGGGGGGGYALMPLAASKVSSSTTVIVGAGGTAGPVQTVDETPGNSGSNGGSSQFGSTIVVIGGRGGSGGLFGTSISTPGGSGGELTPSGSYSPVFRIVLGSSNIVNTSPYTGAPFNDSLSINDQSIYGIYGGAAGVSSSDTQGPLTASGGSSMFGGGGGGAGDLSFGGGPAGANTNGGVGGVNGIPSDATLTAGHGGVQNTAGTAGSRACGGGGGGFSNNGTNSGAGGAGGAGVVRVWYS